MCRWTHCVNQNPITAEVRDARLQVSQVSTGCPAGIPARIKKSQHPQLLPPSHMWGNWNFIGFFLPIYIYIMFNK